MSDRPIISLLHPTMRVKPSEQFPRGWKGVHDVWFQRADHPERIEYVRSVHRSRLNEDVLSGGRSDDWGSFVDVINNNRDCAVDQLNAAAEYSSGQLLIGVQDDLYPPEHWDTLILFALQGGSDYPDHLEAAIEREHIIVCSSGATPERDRELMICGGMTRKRYERYGFILDPDFESMFADNWYAHVARRDEAAGLVRIIERLDIQFEHRHPIFIGGSLDEAYKQQNRAEAYRQGQALFLKKAHGTQSLAVCLPGETFRAEIFWDRFSLLNYLNSGMRFLVAPFGEHSSNVYHTRITLAREVLKALPDVDLVLSIDDDNSLTGEQFNWLLQDLKEHPELSGVVGWCWCDHNGKMINEDGTPNPWKMSVGRQGSWEDGLPAWNLTLDDLQNARDEGRYLITSDDLAPDGFWSGFPVVLLRGDCLRELGPLAFAPVTNPIFQDGFTGEDASFFYRARVAGMKFGVDLRVESNHCKFRPLKPPYVPKEVEALKEIPVMAG